MIMIKVRSLRILYIGCIPPEVGGPSPGGVATHLWELAQESRKRGYNVSVVGNAKKTIEKSGIEIFAPMQNKLIKVIKTAKVLPMLKKQRFPFFGFLSYREKISVLYWAYFLHTIIERIKPDVIHVHELFNKSILSLKLIQNTIPIVITGHGFWQGLKNDKSMAMVKYALDYADCVICVSEFEKEQFRHFNLNHKKKLKVIHYPINPDKVPLLVTQEIKQELALGDKKVIFFSGVSEPVKRKGLDILLKTMTINPYLREKCKVIIIANGEGTEYAQKFVKQNVIDGLILGPQPWAKIVKFYNAADVFVMPSRSEGFATVYIEALLAGIPIIGLYWNISELEKSLGIYVGEKFNADKENEKALAEKIVKVLNTNIDRELLRRKAIEKLSWDTKFSEFDSVYKELLAKKYQK